MIEITGKYNTAICYTNEIDDGARAQITEMCNHEALAQSKIRIMPDVHMGTGATVGTTMTIKDKIIPAMVGVDIGCGMFTVSLGKVDIDLPTLDALVHTIPSGRDVWDTPIEEFDLTGLKCYSNLKKFKVLKGSLGTLGGGNHFIEIDEDEDKNKYLVIHSGSRNLGTKVAEFYQNEAVEILKGRSEYFAERERIITEYKEDERRALIQKTIKKMEKEWKDKKPPLAPSLCYLEGEPMENYLHDVKICQAFALRSREAMARIIVEGMGFEVKESFHTTHNYIDYDGMVLRKGSVSAKKGEKLLIPINMRDGALICIGKGNDEWNQSAPHGAGRLMSRSSAFHRLTMEEYEKEMAGIYSTCVVRSTLDESPMAYKSIDTIMAQIVPTADILLRIKPIYNFKATQ